MAAESPNGYLPSELEVVARLLLQDQSVRVVPGAWWSYRPERAEVVYPPNLLAEWSTYRSLGALCHEIAEVLFSGREAGRVVPEFVQRAAAQGCEPHAAGILLNTVNDLRVNERYLERYPGSRRFLSAVYGRAQPLDPLNDPAARSSRNPLPHHALLSALTGRWAARLGLPIASPDERVRRVSDTLWPAVTRAIAAASLDDLAQIVLVEVLPAYTELLRRGLDEAKREVPDDEPDDALPPPSDQDEDASQLSDDDRKFIERGAASEAPVESWVVLTDTAAPPETESPPRPPPVAPPPSAQPAERDPTNTGPSSTWFDGIVQRFRRAGRRTDRGRAYEEFNYVDAVHRLQPQIDAVLYGATGRDGLIAILNRRRFGTIDPWRRPRRRRRGDSGEIDPDHPENLFLSPATAFLKGPNLRRDDSQKDFAHAILLDVSGSMVQYGYRSRKFDQLIDTAVVFCEIHQRLKLPYELIAFSDNPTVLRSLAECQYDSLQIDPASAHVVSDLSYVVREMYRLDHGETHETPALERAIADLSERPGLKTLFVVTDGISSERSVLTGRLVELEEHNRVVPAREGLMVVAFGLGLAEEEFALSYEPLFEGEPVSCASARLVPSIDDLPDIVCDSVDWRIRTA